MEETGTTPRGRRVQAVTAHPARAGAAIAFVAAAVHLALGPRASVEFAVAVLCVIAGVYIGFALTQPRERPAFVEFATACAFGALALAGLWINRWLIVGGYVLHALWDLAHHNAARAMPGASALTRVPGWYIPLCVVVDLGIALALALIWSRG